MVDAYLFGAAAKCAANSEEHTAEEYRRGAELTEPHLATPAPAPVNHIDRVAQWRCSGAAVSDSGDSSDKDSLARAELPSSLHAGRCSVNN